MGEGEHKKVAARGYILLCVDILSYLEILSNGKGNKTKNKALRIFVMYPTLFEFSCEIIAVKDYVLPFWVYFSYRVSSWPKNETTGLHACLHSTAAPASSVLRLHSLSVVVFTTDVATLPTTVRMIN